MKIDGWGIPIKSKNKRDKLNASFPPFQLITSLSNYISRKKRKLDCLTSVEKASARNALLGQTSELGTTLPES